MKSHIIASSQPPPNAYPETAAIIGFLIFIIILCSAPKKSVINISTKLFSDISFISAPAAKTFSDPVIIITRTLLSLSAKVSDVINSLSKAELSAFNASGRSSVIVQILSLFSTNRVLYVITISFNFFKYLFCDFQFVNDLLLALITIVACSS